MPPATQSTTNIQGGISSSVAKSDYGLGNSTTVSPTVVSSQGAINGIPGILNRANNYTNPQGTQGGQGNQNNTQNNGQQGQGTDNPTDTSNMSYEDIYNSALGKQNAQPVDPVIQAEMNLIQGQMANQDAVTQASIGAVQNAYQSRLADVQQSQAGRTAELEHGLILSGGLRSPGAYTGILSGNEKYNLQALNDLQSTEQTQIAQLNQAKAQNDYKGMSDQLALLDKTRQDKITLAGNIASSMVATNKDTRDKLQSAQADASKTALSNGAPQAVIDAIKNAKTPADAYAAASGYGGGANIDVEKITNVDGSQSIVRVDKNTGKIIGTTNIGGSTIDPGKGSPLSPADYKDFITGLTPEGATNFNKLNPQDQSNVKQLINGDALLSDLFTSRGAGASSLRQQTLQKAQSVDPTFSENTNKQRYQFKTQWNNPNSGIGKVNNSINTALGHLADTKLSSDALDNEGLKFINGATNWINTETGNAGVLKLKTDISALATEIATIYKGGTQPSEPEIADWKNVLSADYSKGQISGVENEVSKLLTSKITASRYQYKTAMGKDLSTSIIDPDKRQALVDAGIDPKNIAKENVPGQPKTGIAAQIDTAIAQNYQPKDIIAHLESDPTYGEKIKAAEAAGHSPEEIIKYLNQQ